MARSISPTTRTSAPSARSNCATCNANTAPSDQPYSTNGPSPWMRRSSGMYCLARCSMSPSTRSNPYIGVCAGSRLSNGS
ncbi:Uncharacterised protein [Mycobacteroides abscessus subsp. abscessus]|nr:Uncharacterised protein [Mycobacteroides abscessus subsp. abscessus]